MSNKLVFRILGVVLTLFLLIATLPVTPVMAQPAAGISLTNGTVGTLVIVAGNGFTNGEYYYVIFGADSSYAQTVVPLTQLVGNSFSREFNVPVVPGGPYTVRVLATTSGIFNSSFTVTPQIATIAPNTGQVGDQVTASGNGFRANTSVTIKFDTTTVATVTSSATGTITNVTFAVPESKAGSHTITGSDSLGASPGVAFNVLPKMSIAPTTGGVGDQVTVSGTGFDAAKAVTITFDGTIVTTDPASVTTTSLGSFTARFTVPAAGRGDHEVKAQDATGNSLSAIFTIGTKVSIAPTTGFVGDQVTVSGTGFGATKGITITFGGTIVATSPASLTTDTSGSFSATFVVPAAAKGAHAVKAEESATVSATATFTVKEKMSISPELGFVGDEVTVSGSGFAAGSTITIYFDTASVGTAPTTAVGSFGPAKFSVPASIKGSHVIKVQDAAGNSATATFNTQEQIVSITPTSGFVGDQVTVSGTGFGGNRSVTLYFDNVSIVPIGTATTDASGNLTATFKIPASSRGSHLVKAQDSAGNSATATVTVGHKMAITPLTGTAGTVVAVTGTGFGANSQVLIKFNNTLVSTTPATITTDANGSFGGSFNVPASPAGSYTVEVSDGTVSATASFTTVLATTINPITNETSPGHVGIKLTISGTGFKADASVVVTYDGRALKIEGNDKTDGSGSFLVVFTIPESVGGDHKIVVSDGATTKEFPFVMESTSPPSPIPLLPPMGFKPKQPVRFDWQDVTDDSLPVTYTLQIAIDSSFNSIVLEKAGLTPTEYTLTEEEELESRSEKEPYYWRVMAVDSAQNASLWTGTGTFSLGFIWPGWMLYVWIGLGVVFVGIFAFWLGRRSAYASY